MISINMWTRASVILGCFFLQVIQAKPKSFGAQCIISEAERRDCGFGNIDQSQCIERGCCWQPCEGCDKTVPWCHMTSDMLSNQCLIPYEEKQDCGYYGIGSDECQGLGCCWRPSDKSNDPWCFKSLNEQTSTTLAQTTSTTFTEEEGEEGDIRLVTSRDDFDYTWYGFIPETGEKAVFKGRLEIYHDGQWGTVCDDSFTDIDADVACRNLGWPYGGVFLGDNAFGSGFGPIWLDEVDCSGSETELTSCSHDGWGSHDCSHSEDVGITCNTEYQPIEDSYERYENTECLKGDDLSEIHDIYGESDLTECRAWCDDRDHCSGFVYARTSCYFKSNSCYTDMNEGDYTLYLKQGLNTTMTSALGKEGEIRLVDGDSIIDGKALNGRLEIYHNGEWGTVCDDGFESYINGNAHVICRQLGLSGGSFRDSAHFGQGSGTIWLDEVNCDGDEQSFTDCSNINWGQHDCSHSEDVSIFCDIGDEGSYGGGSGSGVHRRFIRGEWVTMDDEDF